MEGKKWHRRVSMVPACSAASRVQSRENRGARYHTALGSAREVISCLEVARAFGYVGEPQPQVNAKLREVVGTLVRLVENA